LYCSYDIDHVASEDESLSGKFNTSPLIFHTACDPLRFYHFYGYLLLQTQPILLNAKSSQSTTYCITLKHIQIGLCISMSTTTIVMSHIPYGYMWHLLRHLHSVVNHTRVTHLDSPAVRFQRNIIHGLSKISSDRS